MSAPSQSAQTEQNQLQPINLNIDFSHRLSWMIRHNSFTAANLSDTVDEMSLRATSILEVLGIQFMDPEAPRISDSGMLHLFDAVTREIEDIRATVSAFYKAEHAKNQA